MRPTRPHHQIAPDSRIKQVPESTNVRPKVAGLRGITLGLQNRPDQLWILDIVKNVSFGWKQLKTVESPKFPRLISEVL